MKKKKKYEFMVLSQHEGYIDDKLNEMQAAGWEVAGTATVHYHDLPTSAAFIYIPLKREIK